MAAVEADQLIVAFEAQVGGFNRDARTAAQVFDKSASDIEKAATRIESSIAHAANSSRVSQQIMQHVARSAADQFAAGTPVLQIFTQHLAQIGEAGAYSNGSLGKFGTFLGGPWGIAVTLATTVAGTLFAKLLEGGETVEGLVEKMKAHARQTALNDQATAAYSHTVEGLTEAIHAQRLEQEKALTTERQAELQALRTAQARRSELQGERNKLAAQIATARSERDVIARGLVGPNSEAISTTLAQRDAQITEMQGRLRKIDSSLGEAAESIRQAEQPLIAEDVTNAFDKRAAAVARYTEALGNLNAQLQIGAGNTRQVQNRGPDGIFRPITLRGISPAEYRRRLTEITAQKNAALKAIEEGERASHSNANQQFGRSVTSAEAAAIARRAGYRVTSANRTRAEQERLYNTVRTAENPVAAPGTSAHERGNALDIAFAPGVTVASIRKTFAEEGVRLTKILKETGHFHVEFANEAGKQIERQAEETSKAVKRLGGDAKKDVAGVETAFASLEDRLDPATAAAREFRQELDIIDQWEAAGPNRAARALELRMIALARAAKPILDRFKGDLAVDERLNRENQRDGKPALGSAKDAIDQQQRQAEGNIRDLADLYETLFTGGTANLWEEFKRQGLRALALLAAQQTFKLITGQDLKLSQGGGGGDLFSQLLSAGTSLFGGGGGGGGSSADAGKVLGLFKAIGGMASGGYAAPGSLHRVNEHASGVELLRMGPQGGTIIPLGQTRSGQAAGTTIVHQHFTLDLRGGITTPQLIRGVQDYVDAKAGEAGTLAYGKALKDMPGRLQQVDTLGTR